MELHILMQIFVMYSEHRALYKVLFYNLLYGTSMFFFFFLRIYVVVSMEFHCKITFVGRNRLHIVS